MRVEDNKLKTFTQHITEGKLATEFEALISCAYNGGPKKDPEVLAINHITPEYYAKYEKEARSIAKAIKTKTKAKGKMIHYGAGAGTLATWWDGRSTPKTDMYIGDVRISLKEAGGSQLMSAKRGEAVSTFKAAMAYMDSVPASASKLAKQLSTAMQEVVVPKTTTIGDFTTKLRAGKSVGKDLQDKAKKFLDRNDAKKALTTQLTKFFIESEEFRNWFVFEAATGFTKFSPEGPRGSSIASWVVKFDTGGNVHECEPLMTSRYQPTAFTKKMGGKVKFRISWKTPSSRGQKTFLALRGDILKEQRLEHGSAIQDIIDEELNRFDDDFSMLNEDGILSKVTGFFRSLYNKITSALMAVAKHGVSAIVAFLGLEPDNVSVSGLEV